MNIFEKIIIIYKKRLKDNRNSDIIVFSMIFLDNLKRRDDEISYLDS